MKTWWYNPKHTEDTDKHEHRLHGISDLMFNRFICAYLIYGKPKLVRLSWDERTFYKSIPQGLELASLGHTKSAKMGVTEGNIMDDSKYHDKLLPEAQRFMKKLIKRVSNPKRVQEPKKLPESEAGEPEAFF